jgi:hypothetical protein
MLKRKLALPTLSLMAVAVAVLVASVAGSASAHKAPHRARKASANVAMLSAFSVLRKTATSGGAPLPVSVARAVATEGSRASTIEPELTGEVEVTGQYPVWVSPRGGNICLLQEGVVGPEIGSSFCVTDAEALAGKLIGLSGKYPTHGAESVVIGLAPDSNTSVQATDVGGANDAVSVHENVYEIVGKAPHTITLQDANGQTTTQDVPGT